MVICYKVTFARAYSNTEVFFGDGMVVCRVRNTNGVACFHCVQAGCSHSCASGRPVDVGECARKAI